MAARIADRSNFLPDDASAKEVASMFVKSIAAGRGDRANALFVAPMFRTSTAPVPLEDVEVAEPEPASPPSSASRRFTDHVTVNVTYTSPTDDDLFGRGPGKVTLVLGRDKNTQWWVVEMGGTTD